MKSIEVIVDRSGELSIDAIGFSGVDCEAATRFLEEALGHAGRRRRKPEYRARRRNVQGLGR